MRESLSPHSACQRPPQRPEGRLGDYHAFQEGVHFARPAIPEEGMPVGAVDIVSPFTRGGIRLRDRRHVQEDAALLRLGVLDPRSFWQGYRTMRNPVELVTTSLIPNSAEVNPRLLVRDPKLFTEPIFDGKVWRDLAFDRQRRVVREIRRQHNAQLRMGRDRMMIPDMFGDAGTGTGLSGAVGNATAATATTFTDSGASFPTATSAAGNAGLQGHVAFMGKNNAGTGSTVLGVIMSNTATVVTVDQWYALPLTGAAGTAPNATGNYLILPGGSGWIPWVALSTSVAAAAGTDVPRTADGLWGDGTTGGASTEQTANGLARAYVGQGGATAPVITPGGSTTSTIALAHTWTYSTTGAVVLAKVIFFNALAAAGNLAEFETLLNATATVNNNGDTVAVTWTFTVTSA